MMKSRDYQTTAMTNQPQSMILDEKKLSKSKTTKEQKILSILMPNIASRNHHNHHHLQVSDQLNESINHHDRIDLINSIEILTDIEQLLRKLSQQLVTTTTINEEQQSNNPEIQNIKVKIQNLFLTEF